MSKHIGKEYRDVFIKKLRKDGYSSKTIAGAFKLTRQRVEQILGQQNVEQK